MSTDITLLLRTRIDHNPDGSPYDFMQMYRAKIVSSFIMGDNIHFVCKGEVAHTKNHVPDGFLYLRDNKYQADTAIYSIKYEIIIPTSFAIKAVMKDN